MHTQFPIPKQAISKTNKMHHKYSILYVYIFPITSPRPYLSDAIRLKVCEVCKHTQILVFGKVLELEFELHFEAEFLSSSFFNECVCVCVSRSRAPRWIPSSPYVRCVHTTRFLACLGSLGEEERARARKRAIKGQQHHARNDVAVHRARRVDIEYIY